MRDTGCGRQDASGDSWDEVWDAYEARRGAGPALAIAQPAPPPAHRPVLPKALALGAFALGCLAGSTWPLLSLSARVIRQDVPGVLRDLDVAPAREALRQELRAHAGVVPGGGAAERMLQGMADAMAEDIVAPGGLRRLVAARGHAVDARTGGVRDPAAVALPRLRPGMDGGIALTLAPQQGGGGLRLRLSYGAGGWQARTITLLEPAARAGAAPLVLAGPGAAPPRAPRA